MYNEEYFYGITDILYFNVYASLLKEHIKKEERCVIKVFKKEDELVVIETCNFENRTLLDTRKDKNSDLMEMDLVFLKTLERYISDYEIENMNYEYIEGIGSWYKVKIPGFTPNDKILKPFFLKKKITIEDLNKYAKNEEELNKLKEFYNITKGLIKFSKPKEIQALLNKIYE